MKSIFHKLEAKKGAGLIQGLVMAIAGLVVGVIIALVVTSTLQTSNLLTADSVEDNTTDRLVGNFTAGIDNVSGKIPTVLLIAAVVLILGVLVLLWGQYRNMQSGSGLGGGVEL